MLKIRENDRRYYEGSKSVQKCIQDSKTHLYGAFPAKIVKYFRQQQVPAVHYFRNKAPPQMFYKAHVEIYINNPEYVVLITS